ncbi:MAG: cell division protein FtsA [Bacteroidales bacterium]|nr:cell division protein FtsA [Bacteroidales bacterium]MCF8404451.1 cell division protein FtsA [Bacteroidales bacterium]
MKPSEIIVGLDIGTTKIAAIVGRKNEHGKIDILGHGKTESIGVKRGVVSNIENTVNSINIAIGEAAQKAGVNIRYVNVGIAGQHIKSVQHRGGIIRENYEDEISKGDVDKLLNNMYNLNMSPGEEIIDVIAQDYIVDNEQGVKEPVGMLGNSLEANFHIIIGQTTAAKNIYKCVTKTGLEVVDLILEPIASAEAVLSEEEKEAGVVLVDIGGGTTDIAIFQDGIIRHTAVIPFGGDVITEDVKEGCTIIRKHAEELKIKFGSSLASENRDDEIVAIPGLRGRPPKEISLKNLASIIQARMEEIVEHVYYEIKNSGYEKKLIAGIVLTGGGALLKHLPQLTEFLTGMDTRIGYPNEHLASEVSEELASPMYSTGIGLVIEGMKRYYSDLEKTHEIKSNSQKKVEEVEEMAQPDNSEEKPMSFLKKIQDFFEKDEV